MSSRVTQELKARFKSIVNEPSEDKAHSLIEFLNNHATSISPEVIKQLNVLIPEEMSHHDIFSAALALATETMNPDESFDKGAALMDAIAQVLFVKARESAELSDVPDLYISVDEDDDTSLESDLASLDLNIFHLPELVNQQSLDGENKPKSSTPPNKPLPSPPESDPRKRTLPKLDKWNNRLDYGADDAIVTNMIRIFNRQVTIGTDGVDKRVVDVQHYGDIAKGILASSAINKDNLISFLNTLAVMGTDNRVQITDEMVKEKQAFMIKALIEADDALECFTETNWAAMQPWLATLDESHKAMIEGAYKAKHIESKHRQIISHLSNLTKKGVDHQHMLESGRSLRQTMADVDAVAQDIVSQSRANFAKINPTELYNKQWENSEGNEGTGVKELIDWFNQVNLKVVNDIINAPSKEAIFERYAFYTRLCKTLMDKGDYNSAMAVYTALIKDSITRLNLNNEMDDEVQAIFAEVADRLNPQKNFAKLRDEYKALDQANKPYVPYMGRLVQDLTFVDDGNKTKMHQRYNAQKWAFNNAILDNVSKIQKNIMPVLARELDATDSFKTDFVHDVKHSAFMSLDDAYKKSLQVFPRGDDSSITTPSMPTSAIKTALNNVDNFVYRAGNAMSKALSSLVEKAKHLTEVVANKVGHIFKTFKTRAQGWLDRKITQANVVNAYSTSVRKKRRILSALNQREAEIGVESLISDDQHNQLVDALNSEQVKMDRILRENPNWHPRNGLSADAAHDFINGLRDIVTSGTCENPNFVYTDGKWIYADKYCFSLSEQDCDEISVFLDACEFSPSSSYYETHLANIVATSSSRRDLINQFTRQVVYPDAQVLSGLSVKTGLSAEQVKDFYKGILAIAMGEDSTADVMENPIKDNAYIFKNTDIDFTFHMDHARKLDMGIIVDTIELLDADKAVQSYFKERLCNVMAFDRSYKQLAKDLYTHCMAVGLQDLAKYLEPLTKDTELDQSIKSTLSVARDMHASSDDLRESLVRKREEGTTPEIDRKRPKKTTTSK